MKIETIQDAEKRLREEFDRFGTLNPPPVFKVATEDDNGDPTLEVDGFVLSLQEDGKWYVGQIIHDYGTMYHKDGSGTPPSEDVVDVALVDAGLAAVTHVFQQVVQGRVMLAMEVIGEEMAVGSAGETTQRPADVRRAVKGAAMAKAQKPTHHIAPGQPAGWYYIINKKTGANVESVKGYGAALEAYRKWNKRAREAKVR